MRSDRSSIPSVLKDTRDRLADRASRISGIARTGDAPVIPRKRWGDGCAPQQEHCCERILEVLKNKGKIDPRMLHKPKVPRDEKLACIAQQMPRRDSVTPQLFHLLSRYFRKATPGNDFERAMFKTLNKFSKDERAALKGGMVAFQGIRDPVRSELFAPAFLGWPATQPSDPELLEWEMLDTGLSMHGFDKGLMALCQVGRVRPWAQDINLIDAIETIVAPWPWINEVNGLRTATHLAPLPFYLPEEYQQTCSWHLNDATGQADPVCNSARDPNCDVAGHQDSQGTCLRVASARVGAGVTLTGFNFISCNCQVLLTRLQAGIGTDTYEVPGFVMGDTTTPIKDPAGKVIADHRVKDMLMFDVPEMTPDGLIEFPPGFYQVIVVVPNDVGYTYSDGTQPTEFRSNVAFLEVLQKEGQRYRVWSDQAHCYTATSGEWGDDELYVKAYPGVIDPASGAPVILPPSWISWDGIASGNTRHWVWDIVGAPGAPQTVNGVLGIGLIGWEVDSFDALQDAVRSFDAAFAMFWNAVWSWAVSSAGLLGLIVTLLGHAAWWVGLVVVVAVLVITLIVSLIWAAWAPPDRIMLDIMTYDELQLYYLTYPVSSLPAAKAYVIRGTDINVNVQPEQKLGYVYTEERQYKAWGEGSRYGIRFIVERDF